MAGRRKSKKIRFPMIANSKLGSQSSNTLRIRFGFTQELLNPSDTFSRLSLDFPEPSKSQDSGDGDNDAEECEDNGNDSKPAVDIRRPVVQKLTAVLGEEPLKLGLDFCGDHRPGGRIGFI